MEAGVKINTQKHEDAAIAAAILQGDVDRYAELLKKYQDSVYAIVARRVPANVVPAVAQDVFVRAYQSLSGYSGTVPFGNWVSRIAIRVCCTYWREQMRRQSRQTLNVTDEQLRWLEQAAACKRTEEADQLVKRQEAAEILEWLLSQMTPEDRTLIESVYIEGMLLREAAAVLNWSLIKTKVRALRARHKMRRLLESIGASS